MGTTIAVAMVMDNAVSKVMGIAKDYFGYCCYIFTYVYCPG